MIKNITQSAKIYADALIETAKDDRLSYNEIFEDINTISQILKSSGDLKKILLTPAVPSEKKIEIIEDVFTSQVKPDILNFLKILAEKKRFDELDLIIEAFKKEYDEIQNLKCVTIISAVDLSDEYKAKIVSKLQEKLQKNIIADWQKDDSIIGGLVIKIDDDVIDTSIKNKLENLSKNIIKGNL